MPNNYRHIQVPGCTDQVMRRAFADLDQAADDLTGSVAGINDDVLPLLTSHYDGTALSYYVNPPGEAGQGIGSTLIARQQPPIRIEMTSGITDSGGGVYTGTAKLLEWDGSTYNMIGADFTVVDLFDKWHHAYTGDKGYLGYDPERKVLFPFDLNVVSTRFVSITGTLARDATTTWTDVVSSQTGSLTGYTIQEDYQIPAGARIFIQWFPLQGTGGDWYPIQIDKCLELV